MKIVCLGGGPSGLYLAISMKLRNPAHDITVYERNRPGDTFGWGVVFSDETMENLKKNDPVSAQIMIDELVHWDMIDCHVNGEVERSDGHGFIGIGRKRMLQILHGRASILALSTLNLLPAVFVKLASTVKSMPGISLRRIFAPLIPGVLFFPVARSQ